MQRVVFELQAGRVEQVQLAQEQVGQQLAERELAERELLVLVLVLVLVGCLQGQVRQHYQYSQDLVGSLELRLAVELVVVVVPAAGLEPEPAVELGVEVEVAGCCSLAQPQAQLLGQDC